MRSRILLSILAILALALSGCAARNARRMTAVMSSWAGQPIGNVIQAWGPPATVYENGNDTKSYVWTDSRTAQLPGRTHGNYVYPGASRTFTRYRLFVVSPSGTIVAWRHGER